MWNTATWTDRATNSAAQNAEMPFAHQTQLRQTFNVSSTMRLSLLTVIYKHDQRRNGKAIPPTGMYRCQSRMCRENEMKIKIDTYRPRHTHVPSAHPNAVKRREKMPINVRSFEISTHRNRIDVSNVRMPLIFYWFYEPWFSVYECYDYYTFQVIVWVPFALVPMNDRKVTRWMENTFMVAQLPTASQTVLLCYS